MTVPIASGIALLLAVYAIAGIGTALFAHARGVDKQDSDVAGGSIGFRVLITQGMVALWPLGLRKMFQGGGLRPAPYSAPHDGPGHRLPHRHHRTATLAMIAAIVILLALGWMSLTTSGIAGG